MNRLRRQIPAILAVAALLVVFFPTHGPAQAAPAAAPVLVAKIAANLSTRNAKVGDTVVAKTLKPAKLTDGTAVRLETAPDPRPTVAPVGVMTAGADRVTVGAAPLLGRSSPEMLRAVADVADAAATVRLTPWRGLVLLGVAVADSERVVEQLTGAGLSADPSDPAHLVSACAGLPGCGSSRADTLGAARDLLDGPTLITSRVHLSGCEKRCGANAEVVLVADQHGHFGTGRQ